MHISPGIFGHPQVLGMVETQGKAQSVARHRKVLPLSSQHASLGMKQYEFLARNPGRQQPPHTCTHKTLLLANCVLRRMDDQQGFGIEGN